MSKINLLSSRVFNRIAAGEVVDRPYSVVKELVENSLDAGAESVTIEIENGGITLIKVSDDGCGIEKSDLKKAILPHATSKIRLVQDLDNIKSFGFRGEALASIASVSKMTLTSKTKEQELGATLYVEGGEIVGGVTDCGYSDGTCIEVNSLFFNTPARERFLHSAKSEESEVTATVVRLILGNPQVSFKYIVDGKIFHQSFGDGLESALVNIYGVEILTNSLLVKAQKYGVSLYGYISKHNFTKGNRSHQMTFINGRYVQNKTLSSAIANAYAPYLMKRQYPIYVLCITMPTEIVDVNVHPNKLDVRFLNNQTVYGIIYSIITKVLDGTSEALDIVSANDSNDMEKYGNVFYTEKQLYEPYKVKPNPLKPENAVIILKDSGTIENNKPICETSYPDINIDNISSKIQDKESVTDIFAENKAYLESLEKKKNQYNNTNNSDKQQGLQIKIERDLKVIGQVLNTYIVLEDGQDIFFIDQHAAHERLLFDKLNSSLKENDIVRQPLLIPFVFNVNSSEFNFLSEKARVLSDMGIEISEFGKNSFKVSAVPAFLAEINLQRFFNDILTEIDTLRNFTLNDLLIEKIAQKACKSAIKSGYKLSDFELNTLIEMLKDNLGLKCPHGRPVAVKITRTEIDKWFKRII